MISSGHVPMERITPWGAVLEVLNPLTLAILYNQRRI